jgi:5-methylcytosine-specific restriction endonuclease McrA
MQEYRSKPENKKKVKVSWDKWFTNNADRYKETKHKNRQTSEYKGKVRLYRLNRYRDDTDFRLKCCLRSSFNRVMKGSDSKLFAFIGCSIDELKSHLESKFQDGMYWDNYGDWHIDHIVPLSSFNSNDDSEMLVAWNYSNLQPLWARDNLRKSNNANQ